MTRRKQGLIDISIPLEGGMMTYPGNPPLQTKWLKTKSTYLTKLTMGTHAGTHVDAPRHTEKSGTSVDELDLNVFYGRCQVLDMTHCEKRIEIWDLAAKRIATAERILLKTKNSLRGFKKFYDDYVYLDGDASEYLANLGVQLVGIDSLSIKQRGSDDTRPHTEFLKRGIPIIEGLDLSGVKSGRYTFIGFPLRLAGREGSPIRAVLIDS